MKKLIAWICLAMFIPLFSAVVWDGGAGIGTYKNAILFGNFSTFDASSGFPLFNNKRLDDRDLDIYYQEDFEASQPSFTCGAGLSISGTNSKTITQAAGSQDDFCESESIAISEKQRGVHNRLCSYSDGENFDLVIWDDTNSQEIGRVQIKNKGTFCADFIPSDDLVNFTAAIKYRFQVVIEEIGQTLVFDNIKSKINAIAISEMYRSSEWKSYTPVFQNFGAVSDIDFKYRAVGDSIEVQGVFRVGASPAGFRGTVGLPDGLLIDYDKMPSSPNINAGNIVGHYGRSITTNTNGGFMIENTINADRNNVGFGYPIYGSDNTGSTLTEIAGNFLSASDLHSVEFRVPIAGWSNTKKGVVVKNSTATDASSVNTFSAKLVNTGACEVDSLTPVDDWISCSIRTTNQCDCTINSNYFSEFPELECNETLDSSSGEILCDGRIDFQFRAIVQNANGSVNVNAPMLIVARKTPADYVKESEKVYTVPIGFKESESYVSDYQVNFWDNTLQALSFNTALLDNIAQSKYIEVSNGPTLDGTATRINAKVNVDIFVSCSGNVNDGNLVAVKNSKGNNLSYIVRSDGGNNYTAGSGMVSLKSGDYLYCRNSSGASREGAINIWVKPSKEEGVYLGTFGQPTAILKDVKPNTVSGGSGAAGSFTTRVLNTIEGDQSFITLSSNQFTLEKGYYKIKASAPHFRTDRSVAKIRNVTDNSDAIVGQVSYVSQASNAQANANVIGFINVTSQKTYELRHFITNAVAGSQSLGVEINAGVPEVYSILEITKVR